MDPTGARRRAQLLAVANAYFEALAERDFPAIPYADNVTLRTPLTPGGVETPLEGKEALRAIWWPPLADALGEVAVLDHYINEEMTAICTEALVNVGHPPVTLRVVDRFKVNAEGQITDQVSYFDPRDVTHPGWRGS